MPDLSEMQPTKKRRIYDLVESAGVDVSDWSNVKGGPARAASNPKYCYEWAYVEPGKVVVLNLWFDSMKVRDGAVVQEFNMRQFAESQRRKPHGGTTAKRALAMDRAVQVAFNQGLPVRVVVCDGSQRNPDDPNSRASRVNKRYLDSEPWSVTSYDQLTGKCSVTRGQVAERFVDQFDPVGPLAAETERKKVQTAVYSRSPEVRRRVLTRASGCCEWCGKRGFLTQDGRIYLETHHIEPLSEGGADSETNVAALCPNHHREAHFSVDQEQFKQSLLRKVKGLYPRRSESTTQPRRTGAMEPDA